MKLIFELNNLTKSPVRKKFLEQVIKKTLEEAGGVFLSRKNIFISMALVSPSEIKKLNRIYRKKNTITDILSFGEYESVASIENSKNENLFLGELIMCYNDIVVYAEKEGLILGCEIEKVVAHGVLHLLGFKHGGKMFALQMQIVNNPVSIIEDKKLIEN